MLQLDPAKRPSAAQLLAHPWVQPTHSHWPMPLAAAQHEFKVRPPTPSPRPSLASLNSGREKGERDAGRLG